MSAHRLTFSQVGLALRCAYPFRGDVDVPERKASYSSRIGVGAHKLIEGTLGGSEVTIDLPPKATEKAVAFYNTWLRWWISNGGPTILPETKYLLDLEKRTSTVINSVGDRDYGEVGAMQIAGTSDGDLLTGNAVRVFDWKTGDPGWVEPAAVNMQLRTVGLASALHHQKAEAHVSLLYIGGNEAESDPHDRPKALDEMDLSLHFDRLRSLMRRLPTAQPTPGEWCERKWCPLRKTCAAHIKQVAQENHNPMPEWA